MPGTVQANGLISVPRRDPAQHQADLTAGQAVRYLEDRAEFPVGDALIDAISGHFDRERLSESTMIRRYATEMGVQLSDVVSELINGEELGRQTVSRFLTNTGLRPLFSPIVEEGLRIGLERTRPAWEGLIARTINVPGMTFEYYEFDNGTPNVGNPAQPGGTATDEYRLKSVDQGAPIPTARVTVSGKSYTLYKMGRGIEWTDESKSAPLDLAQMWFAQVGVQLGWDYHDQVVTMLLEGYHDDGSDDAPVLATASAGVITDADLFTAVGTMQTVYGFDPDVMLMPLATQVALSTLENGAGQRIFPSGLQAAGLPRSQLAATVPSDKIVFVDTGFALVRFVAKEFGTEFDRSPQTQTEGSYGSEISLTAPLFRYARLILDA